MNNLELSEHICLTDLFINSNLYSKKYKFNHYYYLSDSEFKITYNTLFFGAVARAILDTPDFIFIIFNINFNNTSYKLYISKNLLLNTPNIFDKFINGEYFNIFFQYNNIIDYSFLNSFELLYTSKNIDIMTSFNSTFIYYISFNYKSIFNQSGKFIPYMISYIIFDPDGIIKKKQLYYTDFVYIYDINNNIISKINLILAQGSDDNISSYFVNDLYNFYLTSSNNKKFHNYLIGYNNSKFDNYFLLNELKKNKKKIHTIISQNIIYNIHFWNFTTIDLFNFIDCSFLQACDDFHLPSSLSFDSSLFQFHYINNSFHSFLLNNIDSIKSSVFSILFNLKNLFLKLNKIFLDQFNINLLSYSSLGGLCYKKWYSDLDDYYKSKILFANDSDDSFFRKFIIGGRSQLFKIGHFKHKIVGVDIVSSYSTAMISDFPILDNSSSFYLKTSHFIPNKCGLYIVDIISQPSKKIIPFRNNNGSLDWNYNNVFEAYITNYDINLLIQFNCKFKIKSGIYWNSSYPIFKNYVLELFNLKKNTHNNTLKHITKLMLNSLSGKIISSKYSNTKLINSSDYFGGAKNIHTIPSHLNSPSVYAVFIYSKARCMLYNDAISKLTNIFSVETDSAFFDFSELSSFKSFNTLGSDLGSWSLDIIADEALFYRPKAYMLLKNNDIIKSKFKGINSDDIILSNNSDLKHTSLFSKFNLYFNKNNLKALSSISFYKHLIDHHVIKILSSHFKKFISFDNISIYQLYIVKSFN